MPTPPLARQLSPFLHAGASPHPQTPATQCSPSPQHMVPQLGPNVQLPVTAHEYGASRGCASCIAPCATDASWYVGGLKPHAATVITMVIARMPATVPDSIAPSPDAT